MKKRLLFFVYIDGMRPSDEGFGKTAMAFNFLNLKRYADRFDCSTFILSMKQGLPDANSIASDYVTYIMGLGFCNDVQFIVEENTLLREADAFYRHFASDMDKYDGELVFFAHTKGTTNTMNDSLTKWIASMYWFSLEDVETAMEAMLSKRKAFYGFPLVDASDSVYHPYEVRPANKYYYYGTMYWMNPGLIKAFFGDEWHGGSVQKLFDRYYAEWFPAMCVPLKFAGTCGDVTVRNGLDLYKNFDDALFEFGNGFTKSPSPVRAFEEHYASIMNEFHGL